MTHLLARNGLRCHPNRIAPQYTSLLLPIPSPELSRLKDLLEANVGRVRRQNEEWFSPLAGIGEVPIGRRRLIPKSESPFPSKNQVTCAFPGVFNDSGHRGAGLAVSGQSGDFTPGLDTAALPPHMGDGPRRCLALENLALPGPAVGVVLDLDVYSRQLAN